MCFLFTWTKKKLYTSKYIPATTHSIRDVNDYIAHIDIVNYIKITHFIAFNIFYLTILNNQALAQWLRCPFQDEFLILKVFINYNCAQRPQYILKHKWISNYICNVHSITFCLKHIIHYIYIYYYSCECGLKQQSIMLTFVRNTKNTKKIILSAAAHCACIRIRK